jgi:hypothetical protein
MPQLQPGQIPPPAVITPDDQRGAIYITGGLAIATSVVCLVVRVYVRFGFGQDVGSDDYAVGGSFVSFLHGWSRDCTARS